MSVSYHRCLVTSVQNARVVILFTRVVVLFTRVVVLFTRVVILFKSSYTVY